MRSIKINLSPESKFEALKKEGDFTNWSWQQRNIINSIDKLQYFFPQLNNKSLKDLEKNSRLLKLGFTPYYASLINFDDLENDPLWKQIIPTTNEGSTFSYNHETDNWESSEDMINPIAQKKYTNRIIVRLSNVCHSYCQFCYEALRTLEKKSVKGKFQKDYWKEVVEYIGDNMGIDEIILSGGEPLMLTNQLLEVILSDIRIKRPDIIIRIHTRALSFNPYRIDDELIHLFDKYEVEYIGIHITHPREITSTFLDKIKMLRRTSILFANIPLLKGINSDADLFREFCLMLYRNGVIPHYLYQFMPFSPGSIEFKESVECGISIIKSMKRHVSNLAVPEFVLPHSTGKHTVPIIYEEKKHYKNIPVFERNNDKYSFVNWKGQRVEFPA